MATVKNLSLPSFLRKLGEALSAECPMNDCQVYRNVYGMHKKMVEDYNRISEMPGISDSTLLAIRKDITRYHKELLEMYWKNYAIECYKAEHTGL